MSKPLKSKAQEALEFLDDLEDFSDLAPAEEGSGDDVAADAGRPHHDDDDTEAASASSAAGADEGKEAEDALKFLNGAFSVDLRLAGCGEGRDREGLRLRSERASVRSSRVGRRPEEASLPLSSGQAEQPTTEPTAARAASARLCQHAPCLPAFVERDHVLRPLPAVASSR